jgi:hypothetical protein
MKNFCPEDFIPLRDLCEQKRVPLCYEYAKKLAQKGELPAAKMGGAWHSTPEMIRTWLYKGMNKAARRLMA